MTAVVSNTPDIAGHYRKLFEEATRQLGGNPLPETFSMIEQAGNTALNPRRVYHTLAHFNEISDSQHIRLLEDLPSLRDNFHKLGWDALYDTVTAVMVRAGAHHDIIYHVDADYIPARILRQETLDILPPQSVDLPYSDYSVTSSDPEGPEGTLLDMARSLFDVRPRDILNQFTGKNEFLSAVYAGLQGLKEGIPLKYLMAEMAMIETTRPFEDADRMDRLKKRLDAANGLLPIAERMDGQEMDAFLLGATHLANVDVLDFARSFDHFLKGSVALLHEAGRPCSTLEDYFIRAGNREAFFLNLLNKIHGGDVAIFHNIRIGDERAGEFFPPRGALNICESRAQENIRKDILMCRALKLSTALAAAVEVAHGEGDLHSIPARLETTRSALTAGYSAMRDPNMTETAMAMRECALDAPILALASYLLGHVSETDLLRLSERVGQQFQAYQERFTAAFATRKTSAELLEWIGDQPQLSKLEPTVLQALGYSTETPAARTAQT